MGLRIREAIAFRQQAKVFGEALRAGRDSAGTGEHLRHRTTHPDALHERYLGLRWRGRRLDDSDDLVNVRERHGLPFEQVGTVARLAKFEDCTAGDDFAAMPQERFEQLTQPHEARLTVQQGNHVDAEDGFQRCLLEQIVQHHFRGDIALQFHHHAHAVLVGLVANFADALDQLFLVEFGNALQQARLVHLVRQFGNDDGLTARTDVFEVGTRTHAHPAAAIAISIAEVRDAIDDAARREVRTLHDFHQLRQRHFRLVNDHDAGVNDFAEVVRRNIRRHADRDTRRAIDQQVRHARGQHGRLVL